MKQFSNKLNETFHKEYSPVQLVKILEKFSSHGWMQSDTYNAIIKGFGENFSKFSSRELAHFCKALAHAGLGLPDVFQAVIGKISEPDGVRKNLIHFNTVFLPLFHALAEVNFVQEDWFKKLLTDEFFSSGVAGKLPIEEHFAKLTSNDEKVTSLLSILKSELDQADPTFKRIVIFNYL